VRYEWDQAKNRSNFVKHGLNFEDAEQVFAGSCITFEDKRFNYGEERLSPWAYWPGVCSL